MYARISRYSVKRFRTVLSSCVLAVAGCANPTYTPQPIPAFMKEDVGLVVHEPESHTYQSGYLAVKHDQVTPTIKKDTDRRPSQVSLPQAILETITHNLAVRVAMEKVQQARADFIDSSIIPNPVFQLDDQFFALPGAHPYKQNNQSIGPPQYDAYATFPIDWLLFGKRKAAMAAARLGIDVANADYADLIRKQITTTLDAFYDVLEAKAQKDLALMDLNDLKRIEAIIEKKVKGGGGTPIELDRSKLAVIDANREYRRREMVYATSLSKLRPLLGRTHADPAFDVVGELGVADTMPVPDFTQAYHTAAENRPDILSDRRDIKRAEAALKREHTKAKPTVSIQPAITYQQTKYFDGSPDERTLDIFLYSTLPTTDRNQGGIARAMSDLRQKIMTLNADLTNLMAEVEQAIEIYRTSLNIVLADDPKSIEAARTVRDRTEAAFNQGGQNLLSVLDAQRTYRDRIRASISTKADYWRALNHLNSAIGIRIQKDDTLPKPEEVKNKK